MTRTDIHRPSAIIPGDYEWVGQECAPIFGLSDCLFIIAERERIRAHMERTGGTYSRHEHGGNCGVCGSVNAIYTHLFYHAPTNSYVRVGTDCTDKLGLAADQESAKLFRAKLRDARENLAGKAKAQAILVDAGAGAAWDVYLAGSQGRYEEGIVTDIVGKLVRYGSASDKQLAFVRSLLAKIENRAAIEAQRAAERAASAPAPSGRLDVVGLVLTVKEQESDFGPVTKMLVKHDTGWKVWVTVPAGSSVERNDRITVRATLRVSDKDTTFAFGSRPSNLEVLEHAPGVTA